MNVEYRLAPGMPFPGLLEDYYAALRWMKEQAASLGIDPDRIALAGDGAGLEQAGLDGLSGQPTGREPCSIQPRIMKCSMIA